MAILRWRHLAIASLLALGALGVAMLGNWSAAEAAVANTTPLPTGSVDPNDDPLIGPTPVWDIVEANGRYYIGGNFQNAAGEPQPYLAAIEVATGRLDHSFRPEVNGEVLSLAISPDGSSLYVGGRFSKINNSFTLRLAKLDAITGEVDTNFDPDPSAAVSTIITDGPNVWVGGTFLTIGGVAQANLAKLDTSGVVDTSFDPVINGQVLDLERFGSRLYFSGNFETVDGDAHGSIAAVDALTGDLDPWAPQSDFKVYDLSLKTDGTLIYSAGAGSLRKGGNSLIAWDTTTGEQVWRRVNAGDFQTVVATDELVYIGTHGNFVFIDNEGPFFEGDDNPNAVRRDKLAAFDPVTGALDAWNPGASSTWGVWTLGLGPSGLLVGGDFNTIGGVIQPHFAVFPGPAEGNISPTPTFTYTCNDAGACSFDATSSSDPDGSVTSYAWDFGDGRSASGATTTAAFGEHARPTVTLVVTDNDGAEARTQNAVVVGDGQLDIELIGTSSANGQATSTLTIPSDAATSDVALAIVSVNNDATAINAPAGWTQVANTTGGSMTSQVFTRTIAAGDAGTSISFTFDNAGFKSASKLLVFRHVNPAAGISATSEIQTVSIAQHSAPAVTTTAPGTVIHYWAERSATGDFLAAPGDEAVIARSTGSGGGHITDVVSLATDPNPGTTPESFAVGQNHTRSALGWTIALAELPTTPFCVATVNDDDTISLLWGGVRDASQFTVRRNGSWLRTGTFTTLTDSPAPGTYAYTVRAIIPGDVVDVSCNSVTVNEPPPPLAQTCNAVLNADDTITLSWDAIDGENSYSVRRNGGFLTVAGNTLSFADDPGAGTWDYVIRSNQAGVTTNTACVGGPITIEDAPPPPPPPPPAVQTCSAVLNANGTITLSWDAIDGEDTYIVRRNNIWLSTTASLNYTDDPGAGIWNYVIRSNQAGVTTNTTCAGGPITVNDAPPPPPPVGPTCSAVLNANGTVTLTWDAIDGEDTYIVRRNNIWLSTTASLNYTDNAAQPGDTYVIRSREGNVTTNTTCA